MYIESSAGDGQWLVRDYNSGRGLSRVHVRDVLEFVASRNPGLIARYGGHAMAAGLTIQHGDLDRFARAFDATVAESLKLVEPDDVVWTDGELEEAEISLATAQLLRELTAYDVVGFQTEDDLRSFRSGVQSLWGSEAVLPGGDVVVEGRTVRAGVFPIGLDVAALASAV